MLKQYYWFSLEILLDIAEAEEDVQELSFDMDVVVVMVLLLSMTNTITTTDRPQRLDPIPLLLHTS
jgi:hypothetical protein